MVVFPEVVTTGRNLEGWVSISPFVDKTEECFSSLSEQRDYLRQ